MNFIYANVCDRIREYENKHDFKKFKFHKKELLYTEQAVLIKENECYSFYICIRLFSILKYENIKI